MSVRTVTNYFLIKNKFMGLKEKSQQALVDMVGEIKKPEWKTFSFWIGTIANLIALGALIVAIIALLK